MPGGRLRDVRVVLMDADDATRDAALAALAAEEARVTAVGTVASALAYACLLRPQVVVADLDEDDAGWRLLEALRKRESEAGIPVVATSRSRHDGEAALHGGFAAFVAKPFTGDALCTSITRIALAAAVADPRP
jgi:CheY-like chemotaxis protein